MGSQVHVRDRLKNLRPRGREIQERLHQLETAISQNDRPVRGSLVIGTYESIAIYFWPAFLTRFARRYSHVALSVQTGRSLDIMHRLGRGDLDAAVTVDPIARPNITSRTLFADRFSFYVATPAPSRHRTVILFEDGVAPFRQAIDRELKMLAPQARQLIQTDSFEVVRAMATSGMGLGVLPHSVAASDLRAGNLVEVPTPGLLSASAHEVRLSYATSRKSDRVLTLLCRELLREFSLQGAPGAEHLLPRPQPPES